MSTFTAPSNATRPACPRCGNVGFVALMRRDKDFSFWNCKKCNTNKPEPTRQPKRRWS